MLQECLLNFCFSSQIETQIEEAKEQISQYKEELGRARVIRRHRQEYDALAKVNRMQAVMELCFFFELPFTKQ